MLKILIVDDSGLSRRLLRAILEQEGYSVMEAEDGMTALERYFIEKPDLVFLDLTMAEMPGLEVLKKLKEMDPGARVIVATADIQRSTQTMVQEVGALGFVNKPFTAEAVRSAIEAVRKGGTR